MANVNVRFSARVIDTLNTEASALAYINIVDTTTLATLTTDLNAWLAALDGVTDGVITHSSFSVVPTLDTALKSTLVAGAEVERTGVFNFTGTVSAKRWGMAVPAFAVSLISSGKIILATTNVTTLTALVAATPYTNATGNFNTTFSDALLSFRKRRKQLSRSSAEI